MEFGNSLVDSGDGVVVGYGYDGGKNSSTDGACRVVEVTVVATVMRDCKNNFREG